MQKITPFFWFDNQAEEAVQFYVSLFSTRKGAPKNSKIISTVRYDEAGAAASGRPKGSVMVINFMLNGQEFVGLNGGPLFKFTEAVSFVINCKTQKEVDYFWDNLCKGGEPSMCGWLKDKYGLSWQVVPVTLGKLLSSKNAEKSKRAKEAMLRMKKIDIAVLKKAFDQK